MMSNKTVGWKVYKIKLIIWRTVKQRNKTCFAALNLLKNWVSSVGMCRHDINYMRIPTTY